MWIECPKDERQDKWTLRQEKRLRNVPTKGTSKIYSLFYNKRVSPKETGNIKLMGDEEGVYHNVIG